MIKASHHKIIYPLFKRLAVFLIKRSFKSATINGDFHDTGTPVLVIANHIGWWDGFWIMLLNLRILKRKFHFMMLEEQLKKHWYFQYTGGYSVRKKSRSVLESIDYTVSLLNDRANMVLMFPQGEIHSIYCDSFRFGKGIERIISRCHPEVQVLFVANTIDYFSEAKPALFINIESKSVKELQGRDLNQEYVRFYAQVMEKQKNMVS